MSSFLALAFERQLHKNYEMQKELERKNKQIEILNKSVCDLQNALFAKTTDEANEAKEIAETMFEKGK